MNLIRIVSLWCKKAKEQLESKERAKTTGRTRLILHRSLGCRTPRFLSVAPLPLESKESLAFRTNGENWSRQKMSHQYLRVKSRNHTTKRPYSNSLRSRTKEGQSLSSSSYPRPQLVAMLISYLQIRRKLKKSPLTK